MPDVSDTLKSTRTIKNVWEILDYSTHIGDNPNNISFI